MIHLDLFSGIGGFAYAADQVWDDVEHIFCEIDTFCVQVLKKHWKGARIYGDIRKLTYDSYANGNGCTEQQKVNTAEAGKQALSGVEGCDGFTADAEGGRNNCLQESENSGKLQHIERGDTGLPFKKVHILTGGFPCQPFSSAGKRRGHEDDRFLWPQMLRVIKEFKPTWIIGENVAGILSMAQYEGNAEVGSETDLFGNTKDIHTHEGRGILYGIIEQLGEIGYAVQTFIIPACAVGAPHRRDRVWIVANRESLYGDGSNGNLGIGTQPKEISQPGDGGGKGDVADWNKNWLEVATKLCGVDDGLPAELDKHGKTNCQTCGGKGFGRIPCEECGKVEFKLSKAGHRVERLKSLGNAIVPQVAIEIMKAIRKVEDETL
jgi:site-specific DNA-cytosine methylase